MNILDFIKSEDSEESLMLILDDMSAKKVLAAWLKYQKPDTHPSRFKREVKKNETVRDVCAECWFMIELDIEELSKIAGLPCQVVWETFERLKAARLVYPDSTVPSSVLRFIRNEVTAYRLAQVPRGASFIPKLKNSTPA